MQWCLIRLSFLRVPLTVSFPSLAFSVGIAANMLVWSASNCFVGRSSCVLVLRLARKESDRQREVWNGSRISATALWPPKPPHLASPSSFLNIESSPGCPLLVTKRDGRCLFDQLCVPVSMRPWNGWPSLTIKDLLGTGLVSISDIKKALADGELFDISGVIFPNSVVRPMGFA